MHFYYKDHLVNWVKEVVTAYRENHTEYVNYTVYAKCSIVLKLQQVLL